MLAYIGRRINNRPMPKQRAGTPDTMRRWGERLRAAWLAAATLGSIAPAVECCAQASTAAPSVGEFAAPAPGTVSAGPLSSAPVRVQGIELVADTSRSIVIGEHRVRYRARVARIVLTNAGAKPVATVFLTSYTVAPRRSPRAVLFVFNGGPGSSSAWLQMGLLGPMLVRLPADPTQHLSPPYTLYDNPESLLDVADLVFIDPAGTGYGRLLEPSFAERVWSSDGDADYIADVIRAWTEAEGRASDSKVLLGESYGAQRAVDVAHRLSCLGAHSPCKPQPVSGLVLVSQSLAMINTTQRPNNVQGIAVGLPTLAALAWYHGRIPRADRSLESVVREAADFADRTYLPALFRGNDISSVERRAVAAGLAALTGLSEPYYLTNGLAITKEHYLQQMLWEERKVMDPSDGRFLSDRSPSGPQPERITGELAPAVSWAASHMSVDVLGVRIQEDYRMEPDEIADRWVYGEHLSYQTAYDYPALLDALLAAVPTLEVVIAGGYYDTKASYGADAFLVRHLTAAAGRVRSLHYEGGHMFYIDPRSRHEFTGEIRKLLQH